MIREDNITFWGAKGLWTGMSLDFEGRTAWAMAQLRDLRSLFRVKGFSHV
jgi:hypothetical protein